MVWGGIIPKHTASFIPVVLFFFSMLLPSFRQSLRISGASILAASVPP